MWSLYSFEWWDALCTVQGIGMSSVQIGCGDVELNYSDVMCDVYGIGLRVWSVFMRVESTLPTLKACLLFIILLLLFFFFLHNVISPRRMRT